VVNDEIGNETDNKVLVQDENHLRLLSIFHYVVGCLTALFFCFPLIHVSVGVAMLMGAFADGSPNQPPQFIGIIFVLIGSLIILFGWSVAGCTMYAGHCLSRRKNHTFCLVIAAISCMIVPFGTILGVLTIIVLVKPEVKSLFNQ